ncbi:MAG: formate--tetrahydrofolate ligase [Acidimicrobiales bacterium]
MMPSDLQIAQDAEYEDLTAIGRRIGIWPEHLEPYGDRFAKLRLSALDRASARARAKYVLISAITSMPLGVGKTTTTVGPG